VIARLADPKAFRFSRNHPPALGWTPDLRIAAGARFSSPVDRISSFAGRYFFHLTREALEKLSAGILRTLAWPTAACRIGCASRFALLPTCAPQKLDAFRHTIRRIDASVFRIPRKQSDKGFPMFTYQQSTGKLLHDGTLAGIGYSGFGAGKNNPSSEAIHNVGPIPRGSYTIGPEFQSETHGPVVHHLTPNPGTNTHGRDGFLMHGDSASHAGRASLGCVIQPRPVRMAVSTLQEQGDDQLTVVSGPV
jgi:hypothetical protein